MKTIDDKLKSTFLQKARSKLATYGTALFLAVGGVGACGDTIINNNYGSEDVEENGGESDCDKLCDTYWIKCGGLNVEYSLGESYNDCLEQCSSFSEKKSSFKNIIFEYEGLNVPALELFNCISNIDDCNDLSSNICGANDTDFFQVAEAYYQCDLCEKDGGKCESAIEHCDGEEECVAAFEKIYTLGCSNNGIWKPLD
ncbi:hypothetical protein HON71_03360 [Candidatus Woesearchaeota archaeon]|jgi:hypothetical protein|nr:hypothetical protein [Candidatus Woesearchaeota archaeon]MBT5343063.1 hypothetical protein [Candidatus Woesearchaeota archaeon]